MTAFADGVVITSARTAVDTAQLMADLVALDDVAASIRTARRYLAEAVAEARAQRPLAPWAAVAAEESVTEAMATATDVADRVDRHMTAVATAALHYCAAEGEAEAYFRARELLLPSAVGGVDGQWTASIAGLRNDQQQARVARAAAWWVFLLARALAAAAGAPLASAAAGAASNLSDLTPQLAALVGQVMTVGGWRTGDGTELDRLQLDLAHMSRTLMRDLIEVDGPASPAPTVATGSWWGSSDGRTSAAAGAFATWLAGAAAAGGVAPRTLRLTAVGGPWRDDGPGSSLLLRHPDGHAVAPPVRIPATRPLTSATWTGHGVAPAKLTGLLTSLGLAQPAGPPPVASPTLIPRQRMAVAATARPASTPRSGTELLRALDGVGTRPQAGEIQILRHDTPQPDGTRTRSWTVLIRGTQHWAVGQTNPQDMLANLQGVAGQVNDQHVAVRRAMDIAGIRAGEPVEFAGHSQGGIVAGMLAADPEVRHRYAVRSVLTCGAPTGATPPPKGTHMLHLENGEDIVPALDGVPNPDRNDQVTVRFRGSLIDSGAERPHDLATYVEAMDRVEQLSEQGATRFGEVADWMEARGRALGFTPATSSSIVTIQTVKEG